MPLDVQPGDEELSYALDDSGVGFIFSTADQTDRLGEDDRVLLPLHHDQGCEE